MRLLKFLAALVYAPFTAIAYGIFYGITVSVGTAWILFKLILVSGMQGIWPWKVEFAVRAPIYKQKEVDRL